MTIKTASKVKMRGYFNLEDMEVFSKMIMPFRQILKMIMHIEKKNKR